MVTLSSCLGGRRHRMPGWYENKMATGWVSEVQLQTGFHVVRRSEPTENRNDPKFTVFNSKSWRSSSSFWSSRASWFIHFGRVSLHSIRCHITDDSSGESFAHKQKSEDELSLWWIGKGKLMVRQFEEQSLRLVCAAQSASGKFWFSEFLDVGRFLVSD